MTETNKPIAKFNVGAMSAAVFENKVTKDNKDIVYHTVSLQKRYKDKEGNWKTATSLRVNDLPKAALCLNKAYEHILLRGVNELPTEKTIENTPEAIPVTEEEVVVGQDVEVIQ